MRRRTSRGIRAFSIAAIALAAAFAPIAASAQAPPPYGHWATQGKIEELVVNQNATCGFFYRGRVKVSGRCTWMSTGRGGILDIIYPMPVQPGHVRYNVVWVNRTTITVWGDVFRLVQ
jgi:hypothetical protein